MKLLKNLFSPRKLILLSLVFVFSLGIFLTKTGQARATGSLFPDMKSYEQEVQQAAKQTTPTSLSIWTYNVGYNMIYAAGDWLLCLFSCPTNKQGSGGTSSSGLQGFLAAAVGTMYQNPPASGIEYLAYLKSNIGIGQPTYAQGVGTQLLDSAKLLDPWIKFRNVAYVFFVMIFVAIGFMIMFRFKINPQVVASVQDSLPKIVVALVLVTLSYAISGLMIDIAWVGNTVVKEVVAPKNDILGSGAVFENPANKAPSVGKKPFPSAWPFDVLAQYGGGDGIVKMLTDGLGGIVGGAFRGDISAGFSGIFSLILAFTVVGATIKIFFSLLTKYITLLLMVLFLPFSFLWSCLPGQEDTGPKTIMSMLSAALSFPAVTLMLALAYYFSQLAKSGTNINEIPPLYYNGAIGDVSQSITSGIIAIGILTIIPNIPTVIDDALQVKGGGLGAGVQQLGGALGKLPIIGSFLG